MSNPENQTPVIDPVAAAGATAQTSGFAQAGEPAGPSSSSSMAPAPAAAPAAERSRGSLSSPTFSSSVSTGIFPTSANVAPQYGYMVAPFGGGIIPLSTGRGSTGGMQSSPNVPAPGTSIDPKTGKPFSAGMTRAELEAKKASELSGREQAARQLAGPGLTTAESAASTPGKELPGGWGPVQPVPAPGTSPDAPASIYDDVNTVLHKVGATAFSVLPAGLKETISNSPDPKGKGKETPGSPTARRSSMAAFYENVKSQTHEIIDQVRQEYNSPGPIEGARKTSNSQAGILGQVKGFFAEATNDKPTGVAGAATFKTSLPSDEPLGARPGEHVSGVGALPGKSTETGVAVLPDEIAPSTSLPSQENQGLLPGEVSAGVGALPGKSDEAGVAIPPADVRDAEGSAGGFVAGSGKSEPQTPSATGESAAPVSALAAPLPQTTLGDGADHGATDPSLVTAGSMPNSAASSSAITGPPPNERTDSLASVTAIRHGHPGTRDETGHSPLATETMTASAISETSDTGAPPSSTAVGTEEPASPRHEDSAITDASPVTKTSDLPTSKPAENGATSPSAKHAGLAGVNEQEKGHRRASSTSSNGKKKTGFMNKLKGEMKVISGKIGGDEAKVLAGEKLKHGEQ